MPIRTMLNRPRRGAAASGSAVLGTLALLGAAFAAALAGARTPVAAAPWAVTPIENQSFEGAFPPPKWQVSDIGVPPGQFVWARTTCTAAPGGGSASVWSIGGGAVGGGLGCAGTYNDWAESDLIYGPIDASAFDGGIDVGLHMKLDLQRDGDFQVCATAPGAEGGLACFIVGEGITQLDWNYFEPPAPFPGAAGVGQVYVYLRFRDREPNAGTPHQGAWIDRVVIRGLSGGDGPSPTPPPSTAVPSATKTVPPATTAAPSTTTVPASATPTPGTGVSTATPTRTATIAGSGTPSPTAIATATVSPSTAVPTLSPSPSETAEPSGTAPATPTTPAPSATFILPPPPTVDRTVTATATGTLESTPSPVPSAATPDGPTATVVVAPPERVVYLPYGGVSRSR